MTSKYKKLTYTSRTRIKEKEQIIMTSIEKIEHIGIEKLIEIAEAKGLDPLKEVPIYLLGRINQRIDTLTDIEEDREFNRLCNEAGDKVIKSIQGKSIQEQEEQIYFDTYKIAIKAFTKGYIQALSDYDDVIA